MALQQVSIFAPLFMIKVPRLVRVEPVVPCHVSVIDHVMTSCVLVLVIVSSLRTERLMSCFEKLMQVTCFVNDCVPVQGARLLEARR